MDSNSHNSNNAAAEVRSSQLRAALSPLLMGDALWANRPPMQREADIALSWPEDVLLSFSLRMAGHGMSISRPLMVCDRRYAMQQIMFAHSLPDARLQKLAVHLLRHLEGRDADRPALH